MTPLIEVQNISKRFKMSYRTLQALKDISFSIFPGETLGLVGESGSGKSTIAKILMQIYHSDSGRIFFEGNELTNRRSHSVRGQIQLVFQDPGSSLNPRMTAGDIIREPLDIHSPLSKAQRNERVYELLEFVGLKPYHFDQYPHEFSGGQKQRICIARALSLEPKFLILDEPISALDLSIQAQIVSLLEDLQKRLNLTYLFISHDLAMVKYISTRVAVMYRGEIVELADSKTLFQEPAHPYTQMLIDAIPIPDPVVERARRRHLVNDTDQPFSVTKGCSFAGRCPHTHYRCYHERPSMLESNSQHQVRCFIQKGRTDETLS